MQSFEVRIQLTDIMLQELLWRGLLPEASTRMPALNDALHQHLTRAGASPETAQLGGVSVVIEQDKVYAELTFMGAVPPAGT